MLMAYMPSELRQVARKNPEKNRTTTIAGGSPILES